VQRKRREIVLRQRYGLLLACLFVLFVVLGIAPGGPWQDALITALAAATLIFALRAGEVTPRVTAVVTVFATGVAIAVAVLAAAGAETEAAARVAAGALVCIAPPAIAVGWCGAARARRRDRPGDHGRPLHLPADGDVLRVPVRRDRPARRRPFFNGGTSASASQLPLLQLHDAHDGGLRDVTARTDLGHTLAVTESLFGQIYLVTVVARAGLRPHPPPGDLTYSSIMPFCASV
jgi:hypothetical protein